MKVLDMMTRTRFLALCATALAVVGVIGHGSAAPPPGKGGNKLSLTVTLASGSILEGKSVQGAVSHNNSNNAAVTVTLSSSDDNVATVVPASVTVPSGEPVVFTVVAAASVSGDQSVTISATADGYREGNASLTVSEPPPFTYQISFPGLPFDATSTGVHINDINNLGQVVGWYQTGTDSRNAFLFDPFSPSAVIDLNTLINVEDLPLGYHIASAVGINDHQVIVGSLHDAEGNRLGFALDYGAAPRVLDLLPELSPTYNYGRRINENGDILGVYLDVDGLYNAYLFNPGFYDGNLGVPDLRDLRGGDGAPIDMSSDPVTFLPLDGSANSVELNNPLNGRPAQIGGTDSGGNAFRYTPGGSPAYESFPEINHDLLRAVYGINDDGTFCGRALVPVVGGKGKGKTVSAPYRFNTSLEGLPIDTNQWINPPQINNSGDLMTGKYVYRDGRNWVHIDTLVSGTIEDLDAWFLGTPNLEKMSDRVTTHDAGHLAGTLDTGDIFGIMFVLTPVVAP
jgi:probable HAF family extracellular repeat protein